jgi:hypothetical protein
MERHYYISNGLAELGALVGVVLAAVVLLLFRTSGLTETYTWVPAIPAGTSSWQANSPTGLLPRAKACTIP